MTRATEYKRYTTLPATPLLDTLDTIRGREGLSAPQLARLLGISYATLNKLRRGLRRPGPKTLSAILRAFPETLPVVLEYLQDGGRPRRQAAGAASDNNGEGALTSRPPREV